MYMKTKELGWKENNGIQHIDIEDSQGKIIVDQRQVLKIWENYITDPYDRDNCAMLPSVHPSTESTRLSKRKRSIRLPKTRSDDFLWT
jgi:hypothetical protein